jgi:hypothetical protein
MRPPKPLRNRMCDPPSVRNKRSAAFRALRSRAHATAFADDNQTFVMGDWNRLARYFNSPVAGTTPQQTSPRVPYSDWAMTDVALLKYLLPLAPLALVEVTALVVWWSMRRRPRR